MKVTIIQPVRHDGKRLNVGDVVDLKEAPALALVACGAAEEQAKKPRAQKEEAGPVQTSAQNAAQQAAQGVKAEPAASTAQA